MHVDACYVLGDFGLFRDFGDNDTFPSSDGEGIASAKKPGKTLSILPALAAHNSF